MQNVTSEDLPKRARYYQGLLDLDMMERGKTYKELNDTTIIFICTFDPIGAGESVCRIKQTVEGKPEIQYNDGTNKIFLSTEEPLSDDISEEMRNFLNYVAGRSTQGDLPAKIQQAVDKAKSQSEWRKEYMLLQEKLDNAREEGREEGREDGKRIGLAKAINQMKKKGMTDAEITELMDISEEEMKKVVKGVSS